ncbi:uncharacterized protein LOC135138641 [Zophobas morio]|uniref:uncharacterized protein LOC135138641 n=1 Tax=Zophobas morio TaxID=2755281 RepID=UPI0030831669
MIAINFEKNTQQCAGALEETLSETEQKIFILKECCDAVNDLCGWLILFNIFSGAFRILFYLEILIKQDNYFVTLVDHKEEFQLFMHIIKYNHHFVLDRLKKENLYMKEQLRNFIRFTTKNRPKFQAARFFRISRFTLFQILNSVTTFLLVIIQFKGT